MLSWTKICLSDLWKRTHGIIGVFRNCSQDTVVLMDHWSVCFFRKARATCVGKPRSDVLENLYYQKLEFGRVARQYGRKLLKGCCCIGFRSGGSTRSIIGFQHVTILPSHNIEDIFGYSESGILNLLEHSEEEYMCGADGLFRASSYR